MFSSTTTTTTNVLQFAYAEVLIDFITNIFYILAPRRQMGGKSLNPNNKYGNPPHMDILYQDDIHLMT